MPPKVYVPQGYVGKMFSSYSWMLFKRGKLRHLAVNITRCLFVYLRKSDLKFFSRSIVSYSLWPDGLRYPRFSCPSLSPRTCLNSWPQSQWCHPTTSSSFTLFSCPQSFPPSESFPMIQLLASCGQSFGALASVLPVNGQGWFPFGLAGLISLLSKGLTVFSSTTVSLS